MSSAQSQTDIKAFLKKLVAEKYISAKEAKTVDRNDVLLSLYEVYLARFGMTRGAQRGMYYYIQLEGESRSEKLIKYLHTYHLIDDARQQDLMRLTGNTVNDSNPYAEVLMDDFDIFHYLYDWRLYQESKENGDAMAYLEKLKAASLLDTTSEIDITQLHSRQEVLGKFRSVIWIEEDKIPAGMEARYRYLYNEMSKLDPALAISNIEFSVVDRSYFRGGEERTYKRARMVFTCARRTYRAENQYYNEEDKKKSSSSFHPFFHTVFNKILVDQNSSKRILKSRVDDQGTWAFLMLDSIQYKVLLAAKSNHQFRYFDPAWYEIEVSKYDTPFDLLSSEVINDCFQRYDSIGLFSHMTHEEKDKLEKDCIHSNLSSCESIIVDMTEMWYGGGREMYDINLTLQKSDSRVRKDFQRRLYAY